MHLIDYSFYLTIVVTILGIAYPLVLQVIANLDTKYASNRIVELFDNEKEKLYFQYSLGGAVLTSIIFSLKIEPLFNLNNEFLSWIINNSAALLLILFSLILIWYFFRLIRKITVYSNPTKFILYLTDCHYKKYPNFDYFEALGDILLQSYNNDNINVKRTINRFISDAFHKERKELGVEKIEYPDKYYSFLYHAVERVSNLFNRENRINNYGVEPSDWLLGYSGEGAPSELTYKWLWHYILLMEKYNLQESIFSHWTVASQFYSFNLKIKEDIYNDNEPFELLNEEEVKARNKERYDFLEFHLALGGLLIYQKRYQLIYRFFTYTRSEPPSYDLLPETMDEVFYLYNKFNNDSLESNIWISHRYPFPQLNGLKADRVIRSWIKKYIALLFLRQYIIYPAYNYTAALTKPQIPIHQHERKQWLESLKFFKKLVADLLDDVVLKNEIGLDVITEEWCQKRDVSYPSEFLNEFEKELEASYEIGSLELELDIEKIELFKNSSREILESTLDKYHDINNTNSPDTEVKNWYISGGKILQNKDSYSEIPQVSHINFHSILAEMISRRIAEEFGEILLQNKCQTYTLKRNDLMDGIENLKINDHYIILNFGINLKNHNNQDLSGGVSDKLNGVELKEFSSPVLRNSLIILKKSDLPHITTVEIEKEEREKYALDLISDKYRIYANVIDLNKANQIIRDENSRDKSDEELRTYTLTYLYLKLKIEFKSDVKITQIIEYSEYRQNGLPNKIEDIKSL